MGDPAGGPGDLPPAHDADSMASITPQRREKSLISHPLIRAKEIQLLDLRLGRTMVKVLLLLGGLVILSVSSRQMFLMFRDGSFRARGNRLIVRSAHPIIFWMNLVGLVLVGVVGAALICWQLLT
jgi:hypothetical protein